MGGPGDGRGAPTDRRGWGEWTGFPLFGTETPSDRGHRWSVNSRDLFVFRPRVLHSPPEPEGSRVVRSGPDPECPSPLPETSHRPSQTGEGGLVSGPRRVPLSAWSRTTSTPTPSPWRTGRLSHGRPAGLTTVTSPAGGAASPTGGREGPSGRLTDAPLSPTSPHPWTIDLPLHRTGRGRRVLLPTHSSASWTSWVQSWGGRDDHCMSFQRPM